MRLPVFAAALLLCAGGAASAAPDVAAVDAPPVQRPASPLEQAFAQDAGIGNQFEITTSQIALETSQDPDVRRFAQKMLIDHHEAEMALARAAAPAGLATHFMFDDAHQAQIDHLQGLTGKAFDEDYWVLQRDAHAATVASLGAYATTGQDPALRAWARATLPVVIGHQRMIADMTGTSAVALR